MVTRHVLACCLMAATLDLVTSFTIRRRSSHNTDLAEALAILQRQRRRVGGDGGGFYDTERLLGSQPITLADVSDWLSRSNPEPSPVLENDIDPRWLSGPGDFTSPFPSDREEGGEDDVGYADMMDEDRTPKPVEASRDELDDIFRNGNPVMKRGNPRRENYSPQKKKKEEIIDVKGDQTVLHKKSPSDDENGESTDVSGLGFLTKEEITVLMKAVQKLQSKGALKASGYSSESDSNSEEKRQSSEEILVTEPASSEELSSVFEASDSADGPVSKETRILVETQPGDDKAKVIEQERISSGPLGGVTLESEGELSSALTNELENEIAEEDMAEAEEAAAVAEAAEKQAEEEEAEVVKEAAEVAEALRPMAKGASNDFGDVMDDDETPALLSEVKSLPTNYWLMNQKRTAKRAVDFPHRAMRDRRTTVDEQDNSVELNLSALSPSARAFARKILVLQGEVDRVRLLSKLEDMENDFLTDALNEATMAQREGSVSDAEWSALQQAIKIEEALQQVKDTDELGDVAEEVSKRGEPWRRKRQPFDGSREEEEDDEGDDDFLSEPSSIALPETDLAYPLMDNVGREEEEEEEEEENEEEEPLVASLFMSNAERCPAVQQYSTNCELASIYSLPIDYEAKSLCNLHEMCYACGYSLGVTQTQCDIVYRAASGTLCESEEACVKESDIFLRAMKLKMRYVRHQQPLCQSPCVEKFLGMY